MQVSKRQFLVGMAASAAFPSIVRAQSRDEIRVGITAPLSGPAAVYAPVSTALEAYFAMVNDAGGINGRGLRLIVADDGFTPNRTLEQTRKLVEGEKVLFMAGQVGSSTSLAARQYLNDAKVPQLFIGSGAPTWLDDIKQFPWSLPLQPSYVDEGRAVADHILANRPNAKVGLLFQNDDAGRGFMRGVREGLAKKPGIIVKEQTTELSEPTVDSQVIALHASGADTIVCVTLPRATSQTIRRASELQWKPQIYLASVSSSIQQALVPAGLDRAKGIISVAFIKDPSDTEWANDAGVQQMVALVRKYKPKTATEFPMAVGVTVGMLTAEVLRQCGNDVSRENVLAQTMKLDAAPPMLLPGLTVKTSESQRAVLSRVRLQQFDGASWRLLA